MTLPDHVPASAQHADEPAAAPPDLPSHPDDVRPWDGYEDDGYERAS